MELWTPASARASLLCACHSELPGETLLGAKALRLPATQEGLWEVLEERVAHTTLHGLKTFLRKVRLSLTARCMSFSRYPLFEKPSGVPWFS